MPERTEIASAYHPAFLVENGPLRILYRSLLKYLRGRPDAAFDLLEEALGPGQKIIRSGYAEQAEAGFDEIAKQDVLSGEAAGEFSWLIAQAWAAG